MKVKKLALLTTLLLILITICGCGTFAADYPETSLIFKKNGAITDVIVESFGADYYTLDGLNTFFNEAISDFSVKDGKGTVSLTELSVENEIARAVLDFDSADTYARFYNANLFAGTINEAYDQGYTMDVTLKSTEDNATISKTDIMAMKDAKIIITDEKLCIKLPYKIKYISANIEIIDEKYVRVSSDSSGLAYIIYE